MNSPACSYRLSEWSCIPPVSNACHEKSLTKRYRHPRSSGHVDVDFANYFAKYRQPVQPRPLTGSRLSPMKRLLSPSLDTAAPVGYDRESESISTFNTTTLGAFFTTATKVHHGARSMRANAYEPNAYCMLANTPISSNGVGWSRNLCVNALTRSEHSPLALLTRCHSSCVTQRSN